MATGGEHFALVGDSLAEEKSDRAIDAVDSRGKWDGGRYGTVNGNNGGDVVGRREGGSGNRRGKPGEPACRKSGVISCSINSSCSVLEAGVWVKPEHQQQTNDMAPPVLALGAGGAY